MNTQSETNLYITVVPGNRIELDFLNNPTMDVLYELQALTVKYPGISFHNLSNARCMLTGSKVHNLEQIGRQLKTKFEAFDFSFNVRGQIDFIGHSVDL